MRISRILNPDESPDEDRDLPLAIARVDSDIKAISINQDRVDVFWVHPNNSLCQVTLCPGKDPEFVELFGPGTIMAGSPLGIISHMLKGMMLAFKSNKNLTMAIVFG
jgi:hypothetical protein